MRAFTLTGLLVITALAGCLGDEATTDDSGDAMDGMDDSMHQGNETSGSENETAAPAMNAPPTANLTANVTNGSAPLSVSFNLTGDDADGDNLTWSLDVDGNGTVDAEGSDLPATFEFTYEAVGNYTAYLNVTDGQNTTTASLLIVVEVPAVTGPNICDRPDATAYGPLYVLDEGGTWIFRESNGIPGLQVGNTHPTGPDGGGVGFAHPEWGECEQADQMLV